MGQQTSFRRCTKLTFDAESTSSEPGLSVEEVMIILAYDGNDRNTSYKMKIVSTTRRTTVHQTWDAASVQDGTDHVQRDRMLPS